MLNRINRSALSSARAVAMTSTAWAKFAHHAVGRVLTTAHHTLTLFGLSAMIVLGLMLLNPEISQQIRTIFPAHPDSTDNTKLNSDNRLQLSNALELPNREIKQESSQEKIVATAFINKDSGPVEHTEKPIKSEKTEKLNPIFDRNTLKQQQWVSSWLSKRYRVAGDAANMLVSMSYLTARETKLDPLLILAVMAIESGFNPFAESPMGAQGLMQVMSKIHHEKFQNFGGVKEALNPHANIRVGASILKDYVQRGGSVEAGLKSYVGASAFENDAGYGSRVIAEYNRLKDVANGKSIPTQIGSVVNAAASATTAAPPSRQRADEKTPEEASSGKLKVEQIAAL